MGSHIPSMLQWKTAVSVTIAMVLVLIQRQNWTSSESKCKIHCTCTLGHVVSLHLGLHFQIEDLKRTTS